MPRRLGSKQSHIDELLGWVGQALEVIVDRPIGSAHPKYPTTRYTVNYGYIPDTAAPDGCEIDAYILGVDHPIDSFRGTCIAVIERRDDAEGKLVVAPPGLTFSDQQIEVATAFQEKHFDSRVRRI